LRCACINKKIIKHLRAIWYFYRAQSLVYIEQAAHYLLLVRRYIYVMELLFCATQSDIAWAALQDVGLS